MFTCVAALSACDATPPHMTPNPGDPERLIDLSSETVTIGIASKNALTKLSDLVAQDQPASADLACSLKDTRCTQAKEIFDRHGIPVKLVSDKGDSVTLSYQRVVTRDCSTRYGDDMLNQRHSYIHSSLGCAVAGNTVQMVTDKRQFTNPSLLDFSDAEKGVQVYQNYMKPPAAPSKDSSSLISGGKSGSSSGK